MNAHTDKEFSIFMSQLKTTIVKLDFFTDFEKCKRNVEEIEIDLNTLNYLLGKQDLIHAVNTLWANHKNAFRVMDILIAVRKKDKKSVADNNGAPILIDSYLKTPQTVMDFLKETGLDEIFISGRVKDLVDYVFGVEVGMDTNARKNRGGTIMETTVAKIFDEEKILYQEQVKSKTMPLIQRALGVDSKQFDFVVKTKNKTYLIEVNFFSDGGGGSKLNEVARSFKGTGLEINEVPGYEFVWITDGTSWNSAQSMLEEAYKHIPKIYNLTSIQDFISVVKKEGNIR